MEASGPQTRIPLPLYPRLFQLGSLAIPTSGVLTAIGIVAALFVARAAARRLNIDGERVWDLGIAAIITALVAPRIILVLLNWSDFTAHPLWLLGVVQVRSRPALWCGLTLAAAVMMAYSFLAKLPFRPTLDALAPGFALGLAFSSIGAFAAGSNFGTSTNLPWAITYTRRTAFLWSGTPLGVPLHPVQIYEALLEIGIFVLLLAMIARRKRWKLGDGQVMGSWLFLSGLSGFFLGFLRGDLNAGPAVPIGIQQVIAIAMVLLGGILWL